MEWEEKEETQAVRDGEESSANGFSCPLPRAHTDVENERPSSRAASGSGRDAVGVGERRWTRRALFDPCGASPRQARV